MFVRFLIEEQLLVVDVIMLRFADVYELQLLELYQELGAFKFLKCDSRCICQLYG